jgi:hypothetical protein
LYPLDGQGIVMVEDEACKAAAAPACSPTREWWLVVLIIQPLAERIEKTFLSLQGNNTLVQEQRQEFAGLIHDISFGCKLKGPLTAEEQF